LDVEDEEIDKRVSREDSKLASRIDIQQSQSSKIKRLGQETQKI
jgi:hypothetical protein